MDLNCGPLALEVTTLPTELQPLPKNQQWFMYYLFVFCQYSVNFTFTVHEAYQSRKMEV